MQSRRVRLPAVDGVLAPASLAGTGTALAEPGGDAVGRAVTVLLIGPEGGWSASELADHPLHMALSTSILRVETAAIVGRRASALCVMGLPPIDQDLSNWPRWRYSPLRITALCG